MVKRYTQIVCDGVTDAVRKCGNWIPAGKGIRQALSAYGWRRLLGFHLCPGCQKRHAAILETAAKRRRVPSPWPSRQAAGFGE